MNEQISIDVHNITVSYTGAPVLWDVDFELPSGILAGIIGPNGSGKTTLLKTIMDIVKPDSGNVKVFGSPIDKVRSRIAYVPQRESVDWQFPISVMEVVLMGRYSGKGLFRKTTKADKEIAAEALESVGMLKFKNRQISELSGGQQQRVFIARALAQKADLYFMDEPFAGVDMATEKTILEVLLKLKEDGKTVLIVHHDLRTVREYFDYTILLNTRLVAFGKTADVLTGENLDKAYGARLTLLEEIGKEIKKKDFPIREKDFDDK
ncbi:MAG: metal ABC transporter ATP-binding protein [Crocinitomicaceae bacterium]|nr:metal ABC transporter ATP-binding protein [Crocinitomicaceae bacterium]